MLKHFLGLVQGQRSIAVAHQPIAAGSGHGWLEAARQFSADGMAETGEQIDKLLRVADSRRWRHCRPTFSRLLQGQLSESQTLTKLAVQSQIDSRQRSAPCSRHC